MFVNLGLALALTIGLQLVASLLFMPSRATAPEHGTAVAQLVVGFA